MIDFRNLILVLGAVLAIAGTTPVACAADLNALDAYIEKARRDWQVPGVSVGVIQDGRVVFARGYGVREVNKAAPVDGGSLFAVGSLTKAFTAAALGLLVDEGKIGWDDPVIEHLPTFRVADPWLTTHITIRDLVSHRTGLEGYASAVVPMRAAQVVQGAKTLVSQVPFRESLLYSNTMYDIAGEVIASVSGVSFAEFVQRRLLQPLRMGGSYSSVESAGIWDTAHLAPSMYGQAPAGRASIEDAPRADVTMPHVQGPRGPQAIPWQICLEGGAAAGSLVSNLDDMLNWARFNLGDGRTTAGVRLLKAATLDELHRPQIVVQRAPSDSFTVLQTVLRGVSPGREPAAYAMGWFLDNYRSFRYLGHGGALLGGYSVVAMLPEQHIAVVVLANSYGRGGSGYLNWAIALRSFDTVLGVEPVDWSGEMLRAVAHQEAEDALAEKQLQQARPRNTHPSLPLADYVGDYRNEAFGPVRVDQVGGELALRLPGVFNWRLEHWHHDIFRLHVATSGVDLMTFFVSFQVDPVGRVASFDPGWLVLGKSFTRIAPTQKESEAPLTGRYLSTPDSIAVPGGVPLAVERGLFQVPENRSKPDSRRIAIQFLRFKALNPPPGPAERAPVFFLAGGPGSEANFRWKWTLSKIQRLRKTRDVVYVSQRGNPRASGLVPQLWVSNLSAALDEPDSASATRQRDRTALAAALTEWSSTGIDLAGYDILNIVDDLYELRAALGYKKIVLCACSFGSQWSLAYIKRWPQTVDRALLSGLEPLDYAYDSPQWLWKSLERLASAADADPKLATHIPQGGLLNVIPEVIQRLEAKPVKVAITEPAHGAEVTVAMGADDLRRFLADPGIFRGETKRDQLTHWPRFLLELHAGDYRFLAAQVWKSRVAPDRVPLIFPLIDNSLGITAARDAKIRAEPAARWLGDINAYYHNTRDLVPTRNVGDEFRADVRISVPMLLLNGDLDWSTSVENAEHLRGFLENGHLIRVGGGTHCTDSDELPALLPAEFEQAYQFLDVELGASARAFFATVPDAVAYPALDFELPEGPSLYEQWLRDQRAHSDKGAT